MGLNKGLHGDGNALIGALRDQHLSVGIERSPKQRAVRLGQGLGARGYELDDDCPAASPPAPYLAQTRQSPRGGILVEILAYRPAGGVLQQRLAPRVEQKDCPRHNLDKVGGGNVGKALTQIDGLVLEGQRSKDAPNILFPIPGCPPGRLRQCSVHGGSATTRDWVGGCGA